MAKVLSVRDKEANFFLDLNNDITRIMRLLDKDEDVKKLLFYIEKDALSQPYVEESLMDKVICRVPLLSLENEVEKDIPYIMINMLIAEDTSVENVIGTELGIDVLVPTSQWIIDEGLRPLILCKYINDIMTYKFEQTGGIKYRLIQIVNINMSDRLLGFRLIYATGIDN